MDLAEHHNVLERCVAVVVLEGARVRPRGAYRRWRIVRAVARGRRCRTELVDNALFEGAGPSKWE